MRAQDDADDKLSALLHRLRNLEAAWQVFMDKPSTSVSEALWYSRSNLNSSVNFKSYLVTGNLTMIKTNCYNVSQTHLKAY